MSPAVAATRSSRSTSSCSSARQVDGRGRRTTGGDSRSGGCSEAGRPTRPPPPGPRRMGDPKCCGERRLHLGRQLDTAVPVRHVGQGELGPGLVGRHEVAAAEQRLGPGRKAAKNAVAPGLGEAVTVNGDTRTCRGHGRRRRICRGDGRCRRLGVRRPSCASPDPTRVQAPCSGDVGPPRAMAADQRRRSGPASRDVLHGSVGGSRRSALGRARRQRPLQGGYPLGQRVDPGIEVGTGCTHEGNLQDDLGVGGVPHVDQGVPEDLHGPHHAGHPHRLGQRSELTLARDPRRHTARERARPRRPGADRPPIRSPIVAGPIPGPGVRRA